MDENPFSLILSNLKTEKKILQKKVNLYLSTLQRKRKEKLNLEKSKTDFISYKKAQAVFQQIAQSVQDNVHHKIAKIVSSCLATIYEDAYTFKIIFEKKRGKTEARFAFIRDGKEYSKDDEIGTSVVELAAFALRVVCIMLKKPAQRRYLQLDEPFRLLDGNNSKKVASMMMQLAKELDFQFVLVTHNPSFRIGHVIDLS